MADTASRSFPVPDGLDGRARRRRAREAARLLAHASRPRSPSPGACSSTAAPSASPTGCPPAPGSRSSGWRSGAVQIVPIAVPDLGIVYDDDDIVVDRQARRRRRASLAGLDRPDRARRPRRRRASGSAPRAPPSARAIVHRLDAGTSGLMVVAKSERAYTALKRAFQEREVEKIYHAVVQGHPDPIAGTIDAPIGRHPTLRLEVRGHGRRQARPSPTTRRSRRSARRRCSRSTSRPAARTRSACTWPRTAHPCVGDTMYGADPMLSRAAGPHAAVAARHAARLRAPGDGGAGGVREPLPGRPPTRARPSSNPRADPFCADQDTPSDCLADQD